MDDSRAKTNPWQAVYEAMMPHVLRRVQVNYDDFNVSLEKRLNDMVQPSDRRRLAGRGCGVRREMERKA